MTSRARKREPKSAAPSALRATDTIKVVLRRADALVPYERNARTHTDAQVEQLAQSILTYGFTNFILYDDRIRAGHARQRAALLLYGRGERIRLPDGRLLPDGTVPVIDCTGWSEEHKRAYVLADNRLALNAGWDDAVLGLELAELAGLGVDLPSLGFDDKELAGLLGDGDADDEGGGAGDGGIGAMSYAIVVRCGDEAEQLELLAKFESDGLTCEALIS